ncbi:putative F-box associated interaction domain, F-box-like domain superfamily [Helianthus annuus]|uniref:Putative F-box domain-containing protein n=1 Tax=Helianthus annuus TaxID=4232 RepID=A0A251TX18_HELAN|nr:putative F-box associated interaction domain, F-box-like domain superfamily [Helianthus annuus]KAJ0542963.1 putative F-box associated interaction domain, F-box-like domain superfamily [Helianthus annuus]KAJ0708018.1 putative F-box associated interaction domain, F-box-like domain superfamily [Helianthus annuus]KAJ0888935.1 putative F-box associated interaction domain, F-box-like domain superfamily [Helianthus annuus]KAJ0893763.1 putative F-box associated interaction domain, F-box-like domain 
MPHQCIATPSSMTDLCAEVIVFQILTRVPAKDVGRSKTVCKEWCALLSTRYFERVHSSRSLVAANQKVLMIRNLTCGVHTINFQTGEYGPETHITCLFHDDITYISILSQLDGLLCAWAQDTHQLFLWNPTTMAYKNLSTSDGLGLYIESMDTLGLYKDTLHDYKIVHVTRNTNAIESHIYSRKLASWRKIPFQANVEYLQRSFFWLSGTQCGTSVYFTVCESWTSGKHVVIAFDIVSEQVTELRFPSVQAAPISMSHLEAVRDALYMFVTTGLHDMTLNLWLLRGKNWINVFLRPPTPLSLWCGITHYMTNGNWFVMTNLGKLCEISTPMEHLECFHNVTWIRNHVGAVFHETVVSPSI